MSDTVLTLIVAHSDLAKALLSSIEKILGKQDNTYIFSNEHDSPPVLAARIEDRIREAQPERIVCFTDLKGGSCWTLAGMLKSKYKKMTVISGVNLPMLATYFNNRQKMEMEALIEKTLADGCRGITRLWEK
jgi:PTS system mannose-specific IIA component